MNKRSIVLLLALVFLMISGSLFAYGGYKGSFQGRALLSEEELAEIETDSESVSWIPGQRGAGMWMSDEATQAALMNRQGNARGSAYYADGVHPMARQAGVRNAGYTYGSMRGQAAGSFAQMGRGGYQNASYTTRGIAQQNPMGRTGYQNASYSMMGRGSYQNASVGMRGGYASAAQTGYRMDPEECIYLQSGERQFLNQEDRGFTGRQAAGRMGYTR